MILYLSIDYYTGVVSLWDGPAERLKGASDEAPIDLELSAEQTQEILRTLVGCMGEPRREPLG